MVFSTLIEAAALRGLVGNPRVAVMDCRFDLADPWPVAARILRVTFPGLAMRT
jgi:hypothetical protein